MKRNTFFKAVMMMVMMMASVNSYGRGLEVRHYNTRPVAHHVAKAVPLRPVAHHVAVAAPVHRIDRHGYLPGWDGRVRFVDGRWGYLRGNRWMWYDTYFDPAFYFAHPVAHFAPHLSRTGAAVAAGVATGVAVGALVSALCH